MISPSLLKTINTHVVDILGHVKGRDQPIMLFDKAIELVTFLEPKTLETDDYIFLDPFCKAGEILLAGAFVKCFVKNQEQKITKDIVAKEIYQKNYFFGLAPDERHFRLSTRTYYGNENSHKPEVANTITNGNYLSETDGRLDEKKFKTEFTKMIEFIKKNAPNKKIIAIGNPPYQESDGGAKASAKPIYNYFIETLIDSEQIDEFSVVIPARWFSAGKGLESFRKKLVSSGQRKAIKYFERAEDVFPTVHVQGGICFLSWKKDFSGKCTFQHKDFKEEINISQFDIIPDDPEASSVIEKILNSKVETFISDIAWPRKPFGLATNYFSKNEEDSRAKDKII